ncbi:DUF5667 domain-containing protein [Saccharothrix obliqua]|uniref:DUF5667 domain-containing protein n=1 Tax=Saccharothrix obliqua TaxID=2861747 RepID=UPI001C5F0D89|nr:DUF5667 domain-containing protein [Saccharothrix obliqua]MBW4715839.1 hypothetical protein [Saccharothrix obliqua]
MVGRGITPLGRHRQRERFARAVEALPDEVDPAFADELAVVALLREAAASSGPDEATRARMRERVLGASPAPLTAVDPRRHRGGGARGRLAVALAAALCLVFSLVGMSLLLSRDALPGDALYGVKRTAESATLGLTFGEESKGYKRLEFASARVAEIETMADRYRDSGGGPLGGYLSALTDFDADAAAGSRVLAAHGATADRAALDGLRDWATAQSTRLTDLRGRLPSDAAGRTGTSLELLGRIERRAIDLAARTTCPTTDRFDEIGPLPATDDCAPPPTATTAAPPPRATTTAAAGTPVPPPNQPPPTGAPATSAPPQAPPPATGAPTTPARPTAPLPPVDTTTPPIQLPTLTLPIPLPGLTG